MISIPYALDYLATVSGATLKFVNCEACGCQFVYRMVREGQASETDWFFANGWEACDRAKEKAAVNLQDRLSSSCDPVPCPECGWYQEFMIPVFQERYRSWMTMPGAALVGLAIFLAIAAASKPDLAIQLWPWLACAGFGLAGLALLIMRLIAVAVYNPNTQDQEVRKALGRSQTIRKDQLDQMLAGAKLWAQSLEGLSLEEAFGRAQVQRFLFRVIMQDGVSLPVSSDFLPERVSVIVNEGKIGKASIG